VFRIPMDVSVGVMAYNEEATIGALLDSLLRQSAPIKEIVVVSSGSTDRTDEIVKGFSKVDRKVVLVQQKERLGKASAINEFLKRASSPLLVVTSADVVLRPDALEHLLRPFRNQKVGIVASHPIPRAGKSRILTRIVRLQWQLHHELSKKSPKYGEVIAFRKVFARIPNTSVDEESIAHEIMSRGLSGVYAPDAIVYNKGPDTVADFLRQRRRISCGHQELKKKCNHTASSMGIYSILKASAGLATPGDLPYLAAAILLEGTGRTLGAWDYLTKKEKHYVWEIAKTTKHAPDSNPADL
jgi:biofilm PGA synthesis N-glycosyltransferase PgaC